MSQKDEIKQKVLIRRKFNQNGKFQWEKGKGGWVGGRTLFSSSLLIWGVKLYFPTVKNWCGNERWAFFCLCVTEANLSWDKTYHSVNFIMFNFVLGREQTVSVLYNHILRLPTCHWVMTFFFPFSPSATLERMLHFWWKFKCKISFWPKRYRIDF